MSPRRAGVATLVPVLLLLATAAGCGGAATGGGADEVGGADVDPAAPDAVTAVDAWIRPTPPVTNVGAFYLTVANPTDSDDRLVGASSPRCAEIEIHRTETVDGVASMALAGPDDLRVPAGGELVLEPSNLHVMCLGLTEPVVAGERVELRLDLADAGEVVAEAVAEER